MVLFLCRNKSSRDRTGLCEDFFISLKRISRAKSHLRGHLGGHNQLGRAWPLVRPGGCSPPGGPADPETDAIKSIILEKIKEKELSYFARRSRRRLLFFIGRPDLESVWGSGEGGLRSSSSPTLLHRQFHDVPHQK